MWIYPFMRRPQPILRITIGFAFASLAMGYAAIVQSKIYSTSPCGSYSSRCSHGPSPLSVWVQAPSYILVAISEIFVGITGLEYAYNKAPRKMKSVVMGIFLSMSAGGSVLNGAVS